MKYFKVKTGFTLEENISITEDELEKAMYAQMSGKVAMFRNGTIRGSNIISIAEDWHKAMGWNAGYELGPEDFAEIRLKGGGYRGLIAGAKQRVEHLLETNRPDLIGKNTDIPVINSPEINSRLAGEINSLAEGFKV